jgi:2-methylaconitate isomerase
VRIRKGFKALVEEAEAQVTAHTPAQLRQLLEQPAVLLVDLRDIRELKREGKIPGSFPVPRGMLEFWIDPDSPYYRQEFDQVEQLVLYCNKGWRSALAALSLQQMGVDRVAHLAGGLEAWLEQGGAIDGAPEPPPESAA